MKKTRNKIKISKMKAIEDLLKNIQVRLTAKHEIIKLLSAEADDLEIQRKEGKKELESYTLSNGDFVINF